MTRRLDNRTYKWMPSGSIRSFNAATGDTCSEGNVWSINQPAPCIYGGQANKTKILIPMNEDARIRKVGNIYPNAAISGSVYDPEGISPTHMDYHGEVVRILTKRRTDEGRKQARLGNDTFAGKALVPREDEVANALTSVTKDNLLLECPAISVHPLSHAHEFRGFRTDVSPALRATDYKAPHCIRLRQPTAKGYVECPPGSVIDVSYPGSPTRRGRVQEGGTISPTVCAQQHGLCLYEGVGPKIANAGRTCNTSQYVLTTNNPEAMPQQPTEPTYRIRKLTPRECFRLMDVDDDRVDTIQAAGISKSQQYKLAGNSIVVSCLYHIFHKMFVDAEATQPIQPSLFD